MPKEIKELLEMEGSVENIVYHNDSNQYTVLEIDCGEELVTVVGTFPYISVGEKLHLYGTWTSHATFGQQFKAEAFERSRPESTSAMLKYLSSGAVKGIGPATAGKIIAAFGDDAIRVIEQDPDRLATIKGITLKKAREISEEMQRVNGIRDLMAFLGGFGVRPEDAVKVWKTYGADSVACIQEDPYRLCSEQIAVEFTVADKLAESLEYDRANTERVKAGILYVLRHNLNNGHTCLPADKLCPAAAKMLGVPLEDAQSALLSLCQSFDAVCENFDGRDFIFLPKQHRSEVYSADRIRMMLKYPPESIVGIDREIEEIEQAENIRYAGMQKEAIRAALDKGLLILTGGPGTGKTTTLNAIIRILMEKGETVFLAAPTGRAAKRMSELTGVEAKTIHRLLQVDWDENDNPVFQRNERNPLECDALVIDELSMVDTYVFESVLRALPIGCRLILVGDSDQLPSVGPGNVIGDLIASGVFPTVQLREIFRQSMESLIVTNAHRIVSGEMPVLNVRDNDFFFMPVNDARTVSDTILSLAVTRLPNRYGYSPVTDIQVLCPGRKGELGTIELNRRLREEINPAAGNKAQISVNGTTFRVGDKVMQIKNNYDLP
ncbi:MAG: AAA family ATPase, partial [Hominenteromicrobium sp.]